MINWRYQLEQYGTAVTAAWAIFALQAVYLFARRGYFDADSANEVLAGTALILLGLVLLIGPLCQFSARYQKYLQYRKELGLVALLAGAVHGLVSLWPEGEASAAGIGERWPAILAGLLGLVMLLYLGFISNLWAQQKLGTTRWWKLQRWGARVAFLLLIFHVVAMEWSGWVEWFRVVGTSDLARPYLPPASLLVAGIGFVVLLIRLVVYLKERRTGVTLQ